MAVFRAVENHVPLARCANTGLTLIATPTAASRARLPVFEAAVLVDALGVPGTADAVHARGATGRACSRSRALALALAACARRARQR